MPLFYLTLALIAVAIITLVVYVIKQNKLSKEIKSFRTLRNRYYGYVEQARETTIKRLRAEYGLDFKPSTTFVIDHEFVPALQQYAEVVSETYDSLSEPTRRFLKKEYDDLLRLIPE